MQYQLKNKTIELTDEEVKEIKELSQKKGVEIKNINGKVIYTSTKSTLKEAVEEAVSSGADITRANLYKANLTEAYLTGTDLRGAYLYGADLTGADLIEANLSKANLRGANLYRANLTRANLYGADLSGAEMSDVKFYGRGGTIKIKESQLDDFLKAIGVIMED